MSHWFAEQMENKQWKVLCLSKRNVNLYVLKGLCVDRVGLFRVQPNIWDGCFAKIFKD